MNENYNGFQNEPPKEEPHCPRCGAPMTDGAVFCGNCGLRMQRHVSDVDALSVGDYVLMMVFFSLPVIGLVLMIYWSFSGQTGINRKNFSRAYLIFYGISLVLSFVMMGMLGSVTSEIVSGGLSLF